jgi:hypothetical protein
MLAREGAPFTFIATCVISASLLGCNDAERGSGRSAEVGQPSSDTDTYPSSNPPAASEQDAEPRDPAYEAEMARIERAKPEPKPNYENEQQRVRELVRSSKKVRSGHGWVYVPRHPKPLRRTATAAVGDCDSRTYGSRGAQKTVPVPQPPGVTATRIGPRRVLVTYRIGGGNEDCRARWLDLRADVSDDLSGAIGTQYPIKQPSGQIVVQLAEPVADADVLSASAWTKHLSAQSSRGTTICIR